jgi:putative sigma-54 modulation protein
MKNHQSLSSMERQQRKVSPVRKQHIVASVGTSMKSDEVSQKIQISANNIELTDSMREYLNSKLTKVVGKFEVSDVNRIEAHLSVVTGPKAKHVHTCEVTCFMRGNKQIIRSSEQTDYMYASIDLVSHALFRRLRKYKERKSRKHDKSIVEADQKLLDEDIDFDVDDSKLNLTTDMSKGNLEGSDFEDPARFVNMSLVKTKEFDMEAISVEDACVCLDYIGHDFYVFRNTESDEINVVYKRKEGGVGLIKPTKN